MIWFCADTIERPTNAGTAGAIPKNCEALLAPINSLVVVHVKACFTVIFKKPLSASLHEPDVRHACSRGTPLTHVLRRRT